MKFGPVVQEMSFKEKNYGRWKMDGKKNDRCTMDAGQRPITIPRLESLALVS